MFPSGITENELMRELGPSILEQRRMLRALHLLPPDTDIDRRARLWQIYDDHAMTLCVMYEVLTKVKITW